jgi:hypothetical protein
MKKTVKKKKPELKRIDPLQGARAAVDDLLSSPAKKKVKNTSVSEKNEVVNEGKTSFTVKIPMDLGEKIRDYLFTMARRDETVCSIAEQALTEWVKQTEKKLGAIPSRQGGKLLGGRPMKL